MVKDQKIDFRLQIPMNLQSDKGKNQKYSNSGVSLKQEEKSFKNSEYEQKREVLEEEKWESGENSNFSY